MAKRGGARPGAGRPKGSRNRATDQHKATLEELARSYTEVAIQALVNIAQAGESESARVSAASAILDRGYGKPHQATSVSGPGGGPVLNINMTPEEAREELQRRGLPAHIFVDSEGD